MTRTTTHENATKGKEAMTNVNEAEVITNAGPISFKAGGEEMLYIPFFLTWYRTTASLSDKQMGVLIRAIMKTYAVCGGSSVEVPPSLKVVYEILRDDVTRVMEAMGKLRKSRREAAGKRWAKGAAVSEDGAGDKSSNSSGGSSAGNSGYGAGNSGSSAGNSGYGAGNSGSSASNSGSSAGNSGGFNVGRGNSYSGAGGNSRGVGSGGAQSGKTGGMRYGDFDPELAMELALKRTAEAAAKLESSKKNITE